jgi:hypothetical protein
MAYVERGEPYDVVDRLLWRDAQHIIGRHAESDIEGSCQGCGGRWPCEPRRLAERAAAASRLPWDASWTARHDLYSVRSIPGQRVDPDAGLIETGVCATPEATSRPRSVARGRIGIGVRPRNDRGPRSGNGWYHGNRGPGT